jgi:cupin superfamily acireductone dioxygenase involved in methionine salvage
MGEKYPTMIKNFYEEHLHIDEEIRYILDGEGYFDVFPNLFGSGWLTGRYEIRMSDGFDVLCPKAISSFFRLGYIIVSRLRRVILHMR